MLNDNYYNIKYTLTESEIAFNSIEIPNKQNLLIATRKTGFMKPKEYSVIVENSNPYIKSENIKAITITEKKKFYEKWYFQFGLGVATGIGIAFIN